MKLKYEKSVISQCNLLLAEQHIVNPDRVGYQLLIDRSLAWWKINMYFFSLLHDFIS